MNREPDGGPVSLLLVDDVELNLQALEASLEELGHRLVRAASGMEALKAVLDEDFAVILLDVVMPGMDGFETAALIRDRDRSRHTPIIFLTAADRLPEHILRGYAVGAVDYLIKPVSPSILQSKVRVFVELFRKSQQVREQARQLLLMEQREHERKLAGVEAQRNRFFSLSLDMMGIIGFDGRFQMVNPAWEGCLGIPSRELEGRAVLDLVHPEDQDAARRFWRDLPEDAGRRVLECRCLCRDGTHRWLSWSAMAFPEDACHYAVARDVTETRSTMSRLARQAADLSIMNADLEQFAYIAAHDLREPLRAVANCVGLLERRYGTRLGPEAGELIRHAVDGATRMHGLIGDLLKYSRLDGDALDPAPVDCGAIVQEALQDLAPALQECGAEVRVSALPSVVGHAAQIRMVFQNLVENAVKYRSQAPPVIQIASAEEGGGFVFTVSDNGIGIKPQYHERIFRIFQRLHDRGSHEGNGIGLAIARKIVERHGGRIWVESAPGEGASFRFTLPGRARIAPPSKTIQAG
ncbi:MAG TPA: ATP-binding protein [Candidatus Polarisedimenticolia bacterium]|nr:ATP-binding protein [Candidatus Polarisedimenticolia bacterium]